MLLFTRLEAAGDGVVVAEVSCALLVCGAWDCDCECAIIDWAGPGSNTLYLVSSSSYYVVIAVLWMFFGWSSGSWRTRLEVAGGQIRGRRRAADLEAETTEEGERGRKTATEDFR